MTEQEIKALCQEVERVCGRSIRAASDYDYLSAQIYEKTHEQVSPSTLMRLFGYRSDGRSVRKSTLDILARYIGYADSVEWKETAYTQPATKTTPTPSRKGKRKALFILLAVIAVVGAAAFLFSSKKTQAEPEPVLQKSIPEQRNDMQINTHGEELDSQGIDSPEPAVASPVADSPREPIVGGIKYSITDNNTVEVVAKSYSGNIDIPSSVTYKGKRYPVTAIADSAFFKCGELTSLTIPNSVTSIGDRALYECKRLTSVVIGNSVESIGKSAFGNCAGLTSVKIPSSVTSIGSFAFYGCNSLNSIVVEMGNSVYDSRDNCNAIIKTSINQLIAGSNNTVIPTSVRSIGNGAFYGRMGLTSVVIPNSIRSIGSYAFSDCRELTSVTIPSSVISIGTFAFRFCRELTSVTIESTNPAGITYGSDLFSPEVYSTATLYVPAESIDAYRSTEPWSKFKNVKSE